MMALTIVVYIVSSGVCYLLDDVVFASVVLADSGKIILILTDACDWILLLRFRIKKCAIAFHC